MSAPLIQEVFGQFAMEVNGKPKFFKTREEAQAILDAAAADQEFVTEAEAFCSANGLVGKAAKTKVNNIVDYLKWIDGGRVVKAEEEESLLEEVLEAVEDAVEVVADVVETVEAVADVADALGNMEF